MFGLSLNCGNLFMPTWLSRKAHIANNKHTEQKMKKYFMNFKLNYFGPQ